MEKKFEEMIKDIEDIINKMEGGEMPLEESIKNFENGMNIINVCSKKLQTIEKSLKIIEKNLNGSITEKDFDEHKKENGSETVEEFKDKTKNSKKTKKKNNLIEESEVNVADDDDDLSLTLF